MKLKMCNYPGCNMLQINSYCDKHRKINQNIYDKNRPEYHKLYATSRWRKLRILFLKANPLCIFCYKESEIKMATVVDHIVDHKGNLDLMYNTSNLQALCASCHNSKTMKG